MKTTLRHIPELDGMRGLAALSVFTLHLVAGARGSSSAELPGWFVLPYRLAGLGRLGVDVFFVLSGFLITSLLLIDREKPRYFRNFYWKRILRIQPVYLLHLALIWFLLPTRHGYVLLGLVFLVNFADYFHVANAGPAWTLSIEEQFYLVWPQIVRRVSLRNLYRLSLAMIAGSALLRTGMLLFVHHAATDSTWYRLDGLGMGALMACRWIGEGQGETPALRAFLRLLDSRALLAGAVVWMAAMVLRFSASLDAIGLAVLPANYLTYRLIDHVARHRGSKWFGWLASRPLVFLGAISYSMYMLHTIVLFVYDHWVRPPSLQPAAFAVRTLVATLATLAACVAVRFLIELPAQRLRKYLLRRPPAAPQTAAGRPVPEQVREPV